MRYILLLALCLSFALSTVAQTGDSNTMSSQDSIKAGLKVKMPIFEGGEERLITYISTFLRYPDDAVKDSIQGRVLVEFMITKTGKVTNAKVLKGISPSCNKEAVRVVSSMPDWIPGEYKGEPVNVIFKIPILFSLKP
ncbi:MAG: energy transducer TonB [Prevotella sp.]|jgi:protein TonB|nr:energy transducer TonB [Prevotella sp.]